ncbi:MAG: hypothetical protein ACLRSW_07865 [Christensenellaceae bacterium]
MRNGIMRRWKRRRSTEKRLLPPAGPLELVGIDVTEAWERLGEITGRPLRSDHRKYFPNSA